MSSQGLNSASYNGFFFTPGNTGSGIPVGFPSRDASDYTRRLKQAKLYTGYAGAFVTNSFVVPVDYTVVQSNENRLSYQFGEITCLHAGAGCTLGPFPKNPLGT